MGFYAWGASHTRVHTLTHMFSLSSRLYEPKNVSLYTNFRGGNSICGEERLSLNNRHLIRICLSRCVKRREAGEGERMVLFVVVVVLCVVLCCVWRV